MLSRLREQQLEHMAAHTVKLGEDLNYKQELDREREWKGYSGQWEHLMQRLRGKIMRGLKRHQTQDKGFSSLPSWNQQGESVIRGWSRYLMSGTCFPRVQPRAVCCSQDTSYSGTKEPSASRDPGVKTSRDLIRSQNSVCTLQDMFITLGSVRSLNWFGREN